MLRGECPPKSLGREARNGHHVLPRMSKWHHWEQSPGTQAFTPHVWAHTTAGKRNTGLCSHLVWGSDSGDRYKGPEMPQTDPSVSLYAYPEALWRMMLKRV